MMNSISSRTSLRRLLASRGAPPGGQRGLTIIGLVFMSVIFILIALVVIKTVGPVSEYLSIRKIVSNMAASGDLRSSPAEIRKAFDRRAVIDSVETITGKDLEIRKVGDGYGVNFRYERRVALFGNVWLLFDFEGSGEDRARGG